MLSVGGCVPQVPCTQATCHQLPSFLQKAPPLYIDPMLLVPNRAIPGDAFTERQPAEKRNRESRLEVLLKVECRGDRITLLRIVVN